MYQIGIICILRASSTCMCPFSSNFTRPSHQPWQGKRTTTLLLFSPEYLNAASKNSGTIPPGEFQFPLLDRERQLVKPLIKCIFSSQPCSNKSLAQVSDLQQTPASQQQVLPSGFLLLSYITLLLHTAG